MKSMSGEQLFLLICKLTWFYSKHIWVDGNEFICCQGPFRAVNSDRDLKTLFCVHEEFKLSTMVRLQGTLHYILGEGRLEFLTL